MKRSLVLCCAFVLGCGDGSGPGLTSGASYQLILVDDQPLPKLVNTFGLAGAQHIIGNGELRLRGSAAFQSYVYLQKNTGSDPFVSFTDSATSTFTRTGPDVIVVHKYGTIEVTDTGYVDGTLLILRQNLKNQQGQRTPGKFTLKYEQQ
jgi:hypothetical protein